MQLQHHISIVDTLDTLTHQLEVRKDAHTVREAIAQMATVQQSISTDEWLNFTSKIVRDHKLSQLFRLDPYTKRAYDKPRGYAGDAVMLDYIYDGLDDEYQHLGIVTDLGKTIFQETVGSPSGQAVRNRKQILADYVDAVAARVPQPTVLSIACGHLREASISTAYADGKIGQWYALDQDTESLTTLRKSYGTD